MRLQPQSSLTLQPIASSVCKTTMVATVATAITLVSSRTTGQKVSTRTEPEITMATTMSVQRTHSYGMIHKTWRRQGYMLFTDAWHSMSSKTQETVLDSPMWGYRWRGSNHRHTQSPGRNSLRSASQSLAARSGNPINQLARARHTWRSLLQLSSLERRHKARLS